ncbi:hypothetical protein EDB85DRAFT_1003381 [Lactarius pseudohatsudake]|nr:hypothetical protein EDB85DRAFT_1003381 [Lactarius pseudohatsudake]
MANAGGAQETLVHDLHLDHQCLFQKVGNRRALGLSPLPARVDTASAWCTAHNQSRSRLGDEKIHMAAAMLLRLSGSVSYRTFDLILLPSPSPVTPAPKKLAKLCPRCENSDMLPNLTSWNEGCVLVTHPMSYETELQYIFTSTLQRGIALYCNAAVVIGRIEVESEFVSGCNFPTDVTTMTSIIVAPPHPLPSLTSITAK